MRDTAHIEKQFGSMLQYEQAIPDYWLSLPENSADFLSSIKKGRIVEIGRSAGGRPIIAIEYGEKEKIITESDQLSSSIAATAASTADPTMVFPPAFFGTQRRKNPVIIFQGALHGNEYTGTVASLNLCSILETGTDLRGTRWDKLKDAAEKCRIIVIPWLNPDGAARSLFASYVGLPGALVSMLTQGVFKDGKPLGYPVTTGYPLKVDDFSYLGAYFNDSGFNLQYDFCSCERQPETLAWMRYYLAERPDCVINWHCNGGSMITEPEGSLPAGYQHLNSYIAGTVQRRLRREGLQLGRLSWQHLPGKMILNQNASIYHVCGALPLCIEMPTGAIYPNTPLYTHEQILDTGLYAIEEIIDCGLDDGFRPYEFRKKIIKNLGC